MQKEIDNSVQRVNFEVKDSFKTNDRKYLLTFDDSSEEICDSKALVFNGTEGRHLGLSFIYNKQNLFHQSNHAREVEL